jgi:hypothetical protein
VGLPDIFQLNLTESSFVIMVAGYAVKEITLGLQAP